MENCDDITDMTQIKERTTIMIHEFVFFSVSDQCSKYEYIIIQYRPAVADPNYYSSN